MTRPRRSRQCRIDEQRSEVREISRSFSHDVSLKSVRNVQPMVGDHIASRNPDLRGVPNLRDSDLPTTRKPAGSRDHTTTGRRRGSHRRAVGASEARSDRLA